MGKKHKSNRENKKKAVLTPTVCPIIEPQRNSVGRCQTMSLFQELKRRNIALREQYE